MKKYHFDLFNNKENHKKEKNDIRIIRYRKRKRLIY